MESTGKPVGELNSHQDLYHKMVDEVKDYAIILLDLNGNICNWNRGAEKIKQYTEKEILGKSFREFYLPEDRDARLPERLLQLAASEGRAVHEGWRLRKDRTRFWGSITLTALHDGNNNVIGFSKVTRDLTERKIAEDLLRDSETELRLANVELRRSREQFQRMISEVQEYAIILLNRNGDIESWNAGAQSIIGYQANEIIGKNFRLFYVEGDRDIKLPEKLLQLAQSNGKSVHEGWRVRRGGSTFWGSVSITALHADDGSVTGFSKVIRDLTERKKAEDRRQVYTAILESKNSELEQFAYIASHDLQEPLRKIRIFVGLMQQELDNKDVLKNYIEKIEKSAHRMSGLIEAVLNYSKLSEDNAEMVDTDLNVILTEVEEEFEILIKEKQAQIESEHLPVIKALPAMISQLFINLIGNALKFSSALPLILIKSRLVPKEELASRLNNLPDKQYLEIAIADNGIGFDQQYETVIFSMFQRLNSADKFKGTGIGLALCRKIMKVHQGFIIATGELNKGATFNLYFPVE